MLKKFIEMLAPILAQAILDNLRKRKQEKKERKQKINQNSNSDAKTV